MDKIHNVDSVTNGSSTRIVDPKTTTEPVCLISGHVGKCSCVSWCGPRLFVCIFVCFLWFTPDLRLTSVWLDNDVTSSPKHTQTHINAHTSHVNMHCYTLGPLVALKVSIGIKKTKKSWCYMLLVFKTNTTFLFLCVDTTILVQQ